MKDVLTKAWTFKAEDRPDFEAIIAVYRKHGKKTEGAD